MSLKVVFPLGGWSPPKLLYFVGGWVSSGMMQPRQWALEQTIFHCCATYLLFFQSSIYLLPCIASGILFKYLNCIVLNLHCFYFWELKLLPLRIEPAIWDIVVYHYVNHSDILNLNFYLFRIFNYKLVTIHILITRRFICKTSQ